MLTFWQWIILREEFNPNEYNALFDSQLADLLPRLRQPEHARKMLGFGWIQYATATIRNVGFSGADLEEKAHEIAAKLLTSPGGLFLDYDEGRHGPIEARFKTAVKNSIRNFMAMRQTRRRHFAATELPNELPDQSTPPIIADMDLIDRFRQIVKRQLGDLALAVLDWRLQGLPTNDLYDNPEFGSPGTHQIKRAVVRIKNLARSFGDDAFRRNVERAFEAERERVRKRTSLQR